MQIPRSIRWPFLAIFIFAWTSFAQAGESVRFSWDRNAEPNIAGYRLYYGPPADPYSAMIEVPTTSAQISDLTAGATYLFAVTAYNTSGAESAFSQPVTYVVPGTPPPVTLDNISSRVFVQAGDAVMIGGFIVQGNAPKKVALRAIGPSLAQAGVDGALSDPILELRDSSGVLVASNDGWRSSNSAQLLALGLAPTDNREAALIKSLPPGAYSATVRGRGAGQGIALFELYNLERTEGSLANISTRGRVGKGDQVMIGGFIIGGSAPAQVMVRAIGPSLAAQGVAGVLQDPVLDLYDSEGTLVSTNDNWRSEQQRAILDSTVAPTDNREAAILTTLAPGGYSAVVRGRNDGEGVALFEVYALNPGL